jgi:hypothetical protein
MRNRSHNVFRRGARIKFRATATPSYLANLECEVMQKNQFSVRVRLLQAPTSAKSYQIGSEVTVAPSELDHESGCDCKSCIRRGVLPWKSSK